MTVQQTDPMDIEGFICPECTNYINEPGEFDDHHTDCPVVTNWWVVTTGNETTCYLCDIWLFTGDRYRMIPMVIYLDDEVLAAMSMEPGAHAREDRPVCKHCCTISLAPVPAPIHKYGKVPANR